MERTAWTQERLDDLATTMNSRFDRVDGDIRELRGEVHALRGELHTEIGTLRSDLNGRIDNVLGTMHRFGGGLILAIVALAGTNLL
jgi:hypothetical protein